MNTKTIVKNTILSQPQHKENNPMKAMTTTMFGVLVIMMMVVSAAQAVDIAVANAGFEDPVVGNGGNTAGLGALAAPGWVITTGPSMVIANPDTSGFTAEAPEASNILRGDGRFDSWGGVVASAEQTGLAAISESKQYELKVLVGWAKWHTLFGDYTISLLKDGAVAASIANFGGGTGPTPVQDGWADVTLLYTPTAGDGGKSLGIRLETGISGGTSGFTAYDDVRLSEIPEPASLALLGLGGVMMMMRRR